MKKFLIVLLAVWLAAVVVFILSLTGLIHIDLFGGGDPSGGESSGGKYSGWDEDYTPSPYDGTYYLYQDGMMDETVYLQLRGEQCKLVGLFTTLDAFTGERSDTAYRLFGVIGRELSIYTEYDRYPVTDFTQTESGFEIIGRELSIYTEYDRYPVADFTQIESGFEIVDTTEVVLDTMLQSVEYTGTIEDGVIMLNGRWTGEPDRIFCMKGKESNVVLPPAFPVYPGDERPDGSDLADGERRELFYRHFLQMADKYPEIRGWLYMSNTRIDCPILWREGDNEFYRTHDYTGAQDEAGSVFADGGHSNGFPSDRNTVIYGANRKDGGIFRSLRTWSQSEELETLAENTQIEIYTREGVYVYRILSTYRGYSKRQEDGSFAYDYTHASIVFGADSKFYAPFIGFLRQIVADSDVDLRRTYDAQSSVCTLVAYGEDNWESRNIVHGILWDFIPID